MELSRKNLLLLLLLVAGVFLFRQLSQDGIETPNADALAARQQEMRDYWYRIPSYPGSKAPEPQVDATPERILWERLQPSEATYEQAREFYDKELVWVGWDRVGEAKDVPGFASPVHLYRSGSYHLLLSKEPEGILLRMTWSADLDLLIDARVGK
ncbi:MAG: hypothetical protein ACOY94_23740 [Bacillota bacterium]